MMLCPLYASIDIHVGWRQQSGHRVNNAYESKLVPVELFGFP